MCEVHTNIWPARHLGFGTHQSIAKYCNGQLIWHQAAKCILVIVKMGLCVGLFMFLSIPVTLDDLPQVHVAALPGKAALRLEKKLQIG